MPNEDWQRLRTPEGKREIRALRKEHGTFEWRELRAHLDTVVVRLGIVLQDLERKDANDDVIVERLSASCRREARFAVEALQHLPSVADWQGGAFHDPGNELDFPDPVMRCLVQVVVDRFDDDPTAPPAFSPEELDALTGLLSYHLSFASKARECLVLIVPEQRRPRHPLNEKLVQSVVDNEAGCGDYAFSPLLEPTLISRLRRRGERVSDEQTKGLAGPWAQKDWPADAVVAVAREVVGEHAFEGAFGWSWFADISERTAKAHAIRVMEQLAGLIALADSARPPRSGVWILAIETETAMGESSKHPRPLVVGAHHVESCVPGDSSQLWFDPWWEKAGRRFAYGLHGYASDPRVVAGRFQRALHFWSRAEAAFGVSAYDAADRFLDYMTAIEVAVSSRTSGVTKSVRDRVASIDGQASAKREMTHLYDVRSRYVHDGLPHVRREDLSRLRELTRLVLRDLASWSVEHGLDTDHAKYVAHCDVRAVGG